MSNTPIVLVLAALLAAACNDTTEPDPVQQRVEELRSLTRAYHNIDQARAAGYDIKITDCMSDAQGGMGYHFGKGAYIDAVADAEKPEVMMYEPAADGSLKLVGVEYVVPFDQWTAATPPQLFGQNFARNETFKVWALHVWIWRDNPAGMFASWNPRVSCSHSATAKI